MATEVRDTDRPRNAFFIRNIKESSICFLVHVSTSLSSWIIDKPTPREVT